MPHSFAVPSPQRFIAGQGSLILDADRRAAEEWLARHGHPNAVLEEVTADEVAADHVEGRVAA